MAACARCVCATRTRRRSSRRPGCDGVPRTRSGAGAWRAASVVRSAAPDGLLRTDGARHLQRREAVLHRSWRGRSRRGAVHLAAQQQRGGARASHTAVLGACADAATPAAPQTDVAAVAGGATGAVHGLWVLFTGGKYASFPPIPRPRSFRVKQAFPRGAHPRAHVIVTRMSHAAALPPRLASCDRGSADGAGCAGLHGHCAACGGAPGGLAGVEHERHVRARPGGAAGRHSHALWPALAGASPQAAGAAAASPCANTVARHRPSCTRSARASCRFRRRWTQPR